MIPFGKEAISLRNICCCTALFTKSSTIHNVYTSLCKPFLWSGYFYYVYFFAELIFIVRAPLEYFLDNASLRVIHKVIELASFVSFPGILPPLGILYWTFLHNSVEKWAPKIAAVLYNGLHMFNSPNTSCLQLQNLSLKHLECSTTRRGFVRTIPCRNRRLQLTQ